MLLRLVLRPENNAHRPHRYWTLMRNVSDQDVEAEKTGRPRYDRDACRWHRFGGLRKELSPLAISQSASVAWAATVSSLSCLSLMG